MPFMCCVYAFIFLVLVLWFVSVLYCAFCDVFMLWTLVRIARRLKEIQTNRSEQLYSGVLPLAQISRTCSYLNTSLWSLKFLFLFVSLSMLPWFLVLFVRIPLFDFSPVAINMLSPVQMLASGLCGRLYHLLQHSASSPQRDVFNVWVIVML